MSSEKKALLVEEVLDDNSPGEQHEKRLKRYSNALKHQRCLTEYIEQNETEIKPGNLIKQYKALMDCGSFLIFRDYFTKNIKKLIAGCTCKIHLLCALCAIRRSAKFLALYSKKIEYVLGQNPSLEPVMITFTIKNGADLAERFDHLTGSMKRLLQKRRNALKKARNDNAAMKIVEAALYSYEVTYSSETDWHPHCHMIALVEKGSFEYRQMKIKNKLVSVPLEFHQKLSKEWKELTGDSFIIDVRRIETNEIDEKTGEIGNIGILKALVEVFKYALKMGDMDIPVQVAAYKILKCRKLIGSFGALRGVKEPKDLHDELDDKELPYIDIIYKYCGEEGYVEIERGQFDLNPNKRRSHKEMMEMRFDWERKEKARLLKEIAVKQRMGWNSAATFD